MRNPLLTLSLLAALWHPTGQVAVAHEVPPGNDAAHHHGALPTIAALDVPRYMGVWFEIAKFPNRFQRQCTGPTSATYSLHGDGTVQVINRCQTDSGITEAIGAARQMGPATSPQLKVRFAPAWLSWLPLVWGNYWVIDLDEGYQLAAVSEPNREYLWILSRTPQVAPDVYARLLDRLSGLGLDISKLEVTRQR